MKKRTFSVLLATSLATSLLWGCNSQSGAPAATASQQDTETVAQAPAQSGTQSHTQSGTQADTQAGSQPQTGSQLPDLTGHTLMIYCGAGMTDPFQEIADAFKSDTGCEMNVTYANAGQIQSQITTSEEGDMFVAGSGDELKPVESYVEAKKDLVKHIPVLAVQGKNPKSITGLADLAGEGVTLIMGDVDATPIGKIAKKALTDAGIFDQVQIVATTATAPQMSTALAAGEADAAIVWKENCNDKGVEIVDTRDLDPYIKTIPAASLSCSSDKDALDAFNKYLNSDAATEIWVKYGYEIVAQ